MKAQDARKLIETLRAQTQRTEPYTAIELLRIYREYMLSDYYNGTTDNFAIYLNQRAG